MCSCTKSTYPWKAKSFILFFLPIYAFLFLFSNQFNTIKTFSIYLIPAFNVNHMLMDLFWDLDIRPCFHYKPLQLSTEAFTSVYYLTTCTFPVAKSYLYLNPFPKHLRYYISPSIKPYPFRLIYTTLDEYNLDFFLKTVCFHIIHKCMLPLQKPLCPRHPYQKPYLQATLLKPPFSKFPPKCFGWIFTAPPSIHPPVCNDYSFLLAFAPKP